MLLQNSLASVAAKSFLISSPKHFKFPGLELLKARRHMQTFSPGDHHSLTAPKPTLNFPESSETESRPLQFSGWWAANHRVNLAEVRRISGPVDNLIEDVHFEKISF